MKLRLYADRVVAAGSAKADCEYYLRSEYDFQASKDNPQDMVVKGTPQRLYMILLDLSELMEVELC